MSTGRHAKQAQRAMAIVDQARLQQVNTQPSRLASMVERAGKPTKLQQKIAVETVTRAGSVEATGLLHEWASNTIARAHFVSHRNVLANVRHLNAAMHAPMDPDTAEDMAAWTTAQKEMLFRHEATLLDGMATNITVIATKTLPDQEEAGGFVDWLLGRR